MAAAGFCGAIQGYPVSCLESFILEYSHLMQENQFGLPYEVWSLSGILSVRPEILWFRASYFDAVWIELCL
jgi:hypothetical protein